MKIWVLNPPFLPKFSRPQRSPAVTKSGTVYFPIWQAYCVGVLEEAGHQVTFTDAPVSNVTREDTVRMAATLLPDLIVMDTSTPSIENDIQVAQAIREAAPQAFLVAVGTHASAEPQETLEECPAFDAIARHEYEYTIRELAAGLARLPKTPRDDVLESIEGLSYRDKQGSIQNNPRRPLIENLDELPWVSKVYKKHLDIRHYFNPNGRFPMVTLFTGRGCPFQCSFCVYPQTMTGHKYRYRSIADVVEEVQYVVREFPEARSIWFEDDTLTAESKRCHEFSEAMIASGARIPWQANARCDLDLHSMQKLKKAGCRELCVGFESANQETLDGIQKGTKTAGMFEFMCNARKAGIYIHGCFMVGFAGETPEAVKSTVDLAIKLRPDTVQFYPVMVYPGTRAYEEYKTKGWLTATRYADWLTPDGLHNCVVCNESMTSAQLVQACDDARRRFYLRPSYFVYKVTQLIRHPGDIVRTVKAARVFLKHLIHGSRLPVKR